MSDPSSGDLGTDLLRAVLAREPSAMSGCPKAAGRATRAAAELLGAMLAVPLTYRGQADYEAAFRMAMAWVNESANKIRDGAAGR